MNRYIDPCTFRALCSLIVQDYDEATGVTSMRVNDFFDFIKERHDIYIRRHNGGEKPWTKDPILQNYRFCNVYRELDTQTIWFAQNWRRDDPDLWFAALVFRFINWDPTAHELGYPVPWDPEKFVHVLRDRKARGEKVYSGAYIISTNGVREEKAAYLAKSLSMIWEHRHQYRFNLEQGDTLYTFHQRLMSAFGVGSFLAAQVVADCKYVGDMLKADDWKTFSASGPGSKRGLNRLRGCSIQSSWDEKSFRENVEYLRYEIKTRIEKIGYPELHAQDIQGCLCEFDKYERVRLNEGRPRSRYKGA